MHSDSMWRSIRVAMDKQVRAYPEHSHLVAGRCFRDAEPLRRRAPGTGVPLRQAFDFLAEICFRLPWAVRGTRPGLPKAVAPL